MYRLFHVMHLGSHAIFYLKGIRLYYDGVI